MAFPRFSLLRTLKHWWFDATDVRRHLPDEALARLEEAVRVSEARHLGELRVVVEGGLSPAALWRGVEAHSRAIDLFGRLRVWDTEQNNGVLIYLLLADRRIEVLADRGLASKVPPTQWQDLVIRLADDLHNNRFESGLMQAIDQVGHLLHQHFPATAATPNPNELPDAVLLL